MAIGSAKNDESVFPVKTLKRCLQSFPKGAFLWNPFNPDMGIENEMDNWGEGLAYRIRGVFWKSEEGRKVLAKLFAPKWTTKNTVNIAVAIK